MGDNYLIIQGGGGMLISWFLAYTFKCISEEVRRLAYTCWDWEFPQWGMSLGIKPCQILKTEFRNLRTMKFE